MTMASTIAQNWLSPIQQAAAQPMAAAAQQATQQVVQQAAPAIAEAAVQQIQIPPIIIDMAKTYIAKWVPAVGNISNTVIEPIVGFGYNLWSGMGSGQKNNVTSLIKTLEQNGGLQEIAQMFGAGVQKPQTITQDSKINYLEEYQNHFPEDARTFNESFKSFELHKELFNNFVTNYAELTKHK